MAMSELKACPFCGAGARLYRFSSQSHGLLLWVQCETCSARAQEFTGEFGDDPEQNALRAVAAWSDRPEEDRLRSALQAAERERDEAVTLFERNLTLGEQLLKERDELRAELAQVKFVLEETEGFRQVEVDTMLAYREVLKWYADGEHHKMKRQGLLLNSDVYFDAGDRARAALEPKEVTGG